MLLSVILLAVSCFGLPGPHSWHGDANRTVPIKAKAHLNNPKDPSSTVRGDLTFLQKNPGSPVWVEGVIKGLPPGEHGFHVHQSADTSTDGCDSTGPHFNPYNNTHGGQYGRKRHQGDLGNIVADEKGTARINIRASGMTMFDTPSFSILDRAIVVHANVDDLGMGDSPSSKTNGNSGLRIGCGVTIRVFT